MKKRMYGVVVREWERVPIVQGVPGGIVYIESKRDVCYTVQATGTFRASELVATALAGRYAPHEILSVAVVEQLTLC